MINNIAFRAGDTKIVEIIKKVLKDYQTRDIFPIEIKDSKFVGLVSVEDKDVTAIGLLAKGNSYKTLITTGTLGETSIVIKVMVLQL